MASEDLNALRLGFNQQNQILEQYRSNLYTLELRHLLLMKILEEKGVMIRGELDARWPQYLKNDVGVVGPDGVMEGSLTVHWYGDSGK